MRKSTLAGGCRASDAAKDMVKEMNFRKELSFRSMIDLCTGTGKSSLSFDLQTAEV